MLQKANDSNKNNEDLKIKEKVKEKKRRQESDSDYSSHIENAEGEDEGENYEDELISHVTSDVHIEPVNIAMKKSLQRKDLVLYERLNRGEMNSEVSDLLSYKSGGVCRVWERDIEQVNYNPLDCNFYIFKHLYI